MECPKCKKTNEEDANFCTRCGNDISKNHKKKCPICLDDKKLEVLICGHLVCRECMDSQYKIKQECPSCRKKLSRCNKCHSYRVLIERNMESCLDCKHKVRLSENIPARNRHQCLECHSKRLLYNHVSDSWNCLDCFCNFTINNNEVRISENLSSTTRICLSCCSNNIELDEEMEYKCLHCKQDKIKSKLVSLEEYSLLRVKNPEEVNMIKKKKCADCSSDKLFEMLDPNGIDKSYYCYTCRKQNVSVTCS